MAFAETTIRAEVDKKDLTTDEVLTYKVTVASAEKKLPVPQTPKFEGFSVVSLVQSTSTAFTQGNVKTDCVYVFVLAPTAAGMLKIPPSTIKIENKTYSSEEFEIEVKQGKTKPQAPQGQVNPQPEEKIPRSDEPQITL